jgi:hypothetical protein
MTDLKTQVSDASVEVRSIPDNARRQDCCRVRKIMKSIRGGNSRMWARRCSASSLRPRPTT